MNVPVDNPNADTEWYHITPPPQLPLSPTQTNPPPRNDILRAHKIIPEKPPSPTPIIEAALLEAQQRAHSNRLEDKSLDELHALEDEEDDTFLEKYRQQRLAELSTLQKTSIHGQVYPVQKPDYARDVTEASAKSFVLVHLTSSLGTNVESRVLTELWREMATKYGDVKFCEIRADLCVEGYPERNTPTILIYTDRDIKRQIVTLAELNGPRTSIVDLERMLVDLGAVRENDVRMKRKDSEDDLSHQNGGKGTSEADDDDDDDDDDDWD